MHIFLFREQLQAKCRHSIKHYQRTKEMINSKPKKQKTSPSKIFNPIYMIFYVTECACVYDSRTEVKIFFTFLFGIDLSLFFLQSLKPRLAHLLVPSFFVVFFEFGSMRFSNDFAFLSRVLPASFSSSESLLFSSSKSGFAIPSFSSRNLSTYSKISIASSTLK